jgi:hypothetical protein
MKKEILLLLALLLNACSQSSLESNQEPAKKHFKDYKLLESSQSNRPTWLKFPHRYALQAKLPNQEKYLYFSFHSGPKYDRNVACNLLRATGRSNLTEMIVRYTTRGKAREDWAIYIQEELFHFLEKELVNTIVSKTYWEKRLYPESIDYEDETIAYACSLLTKVSRHQVANMFKTMRRHLLKSFPDNPDLLDVSLKWSDEFIHYWTSHK